MGSYRTAWQPVQANKTVVIETSTDSYNLY
jgi:hypothetical protein